LASADAAGVEGAGNCVEEGDDAGICRGGRPWRGGGGMAGRADMIGFSMANGCRLVKGVVWIVEGCQKYLPGNRLDKPRSS
jgi:hypothetical protein